MPKIEHIAIWVADLEGCRDFYCRYFDGTSGPRYHNPEKQFTSYFIEFEENGRLELMHKPGLANSSHERTGYAHMAFSTGSRENVDALTERMRMDKVKIVGEPRTTGDGYYESVISDPEGNLVEITV